MTIFDVLNQDAGLKMELCKNKKIMTFGQSILEKLNNPEKVDFAYQGDYLVISAEATSRYTLRNLRGKKVLYCGKLIREILEHFGIEYDEDFYKAFSEVEKIEGQGNAISIKMKSEPGEQ